MTEWLNVSDITPRIAYTATALQTVFTVPFVFFSTSDLHVYQNTALLTLGTHYTVAGAENEAGGTVTLVTGCTVGDAILIVRDVPITQTTHIPPSGPLDISAINIQISKLIAIDQQLQNKTTRTLHFPDSDSTLSGELAAVTSRKNKLLGFDTNGAIIYPLGPTFVGETSTGVAHVDSRATAQVTTFAASVNIIVTAGYASPGDGGGWVYKRGNASSPGVFQDAGGVYWGLDIGTSAVSVRWFGAKGDGVTNDSAAIQLAIDSLSSGGTVLFPRGGYLSNTTLTITGSHIRLLGEHVGATSIFSTNTNATVLTVTGTRHSIENLLIYSNKFASSSGSIVGFVDAIECKIDNCWLQGGYYTLSITGTNSAGCILSRSTLTFGTGPTLLWIARGGAGLNGGHFIWRTLFNQQYPGGVPTSTNFLGAWASVTAYIAGDIVQSGSYNLRCTVGGTSGIGPAPSGAWYDTDITDGTVTWRLVGHTSYRAAHIDTGSSLITFRECDFTGPYQNAISISNTLGGDIPWGIHIEHCEASGPITAGLSVSAGREIVIDSFFTAGATGTGTTTGISLSGTEAVQVTRCRVFSYTQGIALSMPRAIISNNIITGNSSYGIHVAAAISHFDISHNQLGTLANRGANGTGILIDAGAGDYYSIIGNDVNGATTGITDNGTGTHARIESNNGHNPPGAAAIGVGASPFTYTAGHYHESIYVNGGTVSIVATSGGNMFSQTNCTIHLGPNESMTVTYSVLPTMTRVRH